MRQRMFEFANKPNQYLAALLRNRTSAQNISHIRDSSGVHNHRNFYKQLYTSQFNPLLKQDMTEGGPTGYFRRTEKRFVQNNNLT